MRVVIQKVKQAHVDVAGERVAELTEPGLLALIGVTHEDGTTDCEKIAKKIAELKLSTVPGAEESATGTTDSVANLGLGVILVSQFTLYADVKKGTKPSWHRAAKGEVAEPLFQRVVELVRARGVNVQTGVFGAHMEVGLVNDGPVTIFFDTKHP